MEDIHGVDVSWLHRPHRDPHLRHSSPSLPLPKTGAAFEVSIPNNTNVDAARPVDADKSAQSPGRVTPATLANPARDATPALSTPPIASPVSTPPSASNKAQAKRPGLLGRTSSEKPGSESKASLRRGSWLRDIGSKFTSQPATASSTSPAQQVPHPPGAASAPSNPSTSPPSSKTPAASSEEVEPYNVPAKPKDATSFFSNFTRKLSSGSQASGTQKMQGQAGVCQRRILNVDPNRDRCLYPELEASKLKKVAFCVDVEIAGGPRYKDDEDEQEKKQKKKDVKLKERAEGEALKHPQALKEEKETLGEPKLESESNSLPMPSSEAPRQVIDEDTTAKPVSPSPSSAIEEGESSSDQKNEPKPRTEEERKDRKERRRKRAEESGSVPLEFQVDEVLAEMDADTIASSLPDVPATPGAPSPGVPPVAVQPTPTARKDKPTTDPVRIYRRCCQLRETPILKRITEQLMAPTCCMPLEPGVVHSLNLTGSRLQPADMVTLGDWLAVVPVKKLLLENADITDEGLRCVLAGLLAAKKPEPSKRRAISPKHREGMPVKRYQERAGVIEKLNLKNNPRVTRTGWKYISLFLYRCRSLKAIDVSMNRFPTTLPAGGPAKHSNGAPTSKAADLDAAETLHKCLSQRSGGSKLEELIVSECGFSSAQVRKIVDAAIVCNIQRLGLAGNHLDDDGLEHVLHYLRSGVCGGLDIGGSDLRGKLDRVAKAIDGDRLGSCWGLSLAGCNLDTASVKQIMPSLQRMRDLRFIDLSHNPDLCGRDHGTISLLRKYLGRMRTLKRIHLSDVGMSPKQAIALADVLPEGPMLAHLSILENPELTKLASATDENSQEEACALYASYMSAVRCSKTLICIDIDVPTAENSEVVKALAKQVVAYSLRNMEQFAIAEATGTLGLTADDLAAPPSERKARDIAIPNVLMHLVGYPDGSADHPSADVPAPDDDYIVGGTGVVKALQYVLGEKAGDNRSRSPGGPGSGNRTPRERPGSASGFREEQRIKAKEMSKDLLNSARKIRARLEPALAKEYAAGDEMAYRRLIFLDQTLRSMVSRFEEEYPETRLDPSSPIISATTLQTTRNPISDQFTTLPTNAPATGVEPANKSDDEDDLDGTTPPFRSRHNSDVSLNSRALSFEEGQLHRLGSQLRRDILDSSTVSSGSAAQSAIVPDDDNDYDEGTAATSSDRTASSPSLGPVTPQEEERLEFLQQKLDSISGEEWRSTVASIGWDEALRRVGANLVDLRALNERDPKAWDQFIESQIKARINVAQTAKE